MVVATPAKMRARNAARSEVVLEVVLSPGITGDSDPEPLRATPEDMLEDTVVFTLRTVL